MIWVVGILALFLGAAIAFLFAERRARAAQTDLAVTREQHSALLRQAEIEARTIQQFRDQLARAAEIESNLRANLAAIDSERSALDAKLAAANLHVAEQKQLLNDSDQKLREAFATLSAEALSKNNEAFLAFAQQRFATLTTEATGTLDERKAQIEGLLKPLQELLGAYQSRLSEVEKARGESYMLLRDQLVSLGSAQQALQTQTTQLVSALRRPQTRGRWGELTLRRLVELAGLSSHCDFVEQHSVGDAEDGRQRPDMIVNLPGNRRIIIDCKAVLDAFLDANDAADEPARLLCMQRHAQHVRQRATQLSSKQYHTQFDDSPDFIVMFLPGEAFMYAAVEHDATLIEDCIKDGVVLATPTTLISLLKSIEFGWRQHQLAENVDAIQQHGRDLYDRIAILANHFDKLGASLDGTVKVFNDAVGSFDTRVVVTARKIAELGARTDKELPVLEKVDRQARQVAHDAQS